MNATLTDGNRLCSPNGGGTNTDKMKRGIDAACRAKQQTGRSADTESEVNGAAQRVKEKTELQPEIFVTL